MSRQSRTTLFSLRTCALTLPAGQTQIVVHLKFTDQLASEVWNSHNDETNVNHGGVSMQSFFLKGLLHTETLTCREAFLCAEAETVTHRHKAQRKSIAAAAGVALQQRVAQRRITMQLALAHPRFHLPACPQLVVNKQWFEL